MNESQVMQKILKESAETMEIFKDKVGPLKESYAKKHGRQMDGTLLSVVLNNLRNLKESMDMSEASRSVDVGNFIQHGYDLVNIVYPNLVANQISSIQPLQLRSGEVYYYDVVYETPKGLVSANDPALSATLGVRADKYYSSEYNEQLATGAVDGINAAFSGTIPNAPLRTNAGNDFFTLTDAVETFTVDPTNNAVLIGDQGGTGTLNVTTGAYSVTFNTAPAIGSSVVARGKVNFENLAGSGQGRAKINFTSKSIYAQKHQLITDYSLDAEYDMSKNFGLNMSDELVKSCGNLIRAEIDQMIMHEIRETAKNPAVAYAPVNWDATVPAGLSQVQHFRTLLSTLRYQSNNIFAGTRQGHGNFIITGMDVASVLEILPEYQALPANGADLQASGPYVAGNIGGFMHIKNPEFAADEWVVGNRGAGAFNRGYVFAPYKPLMVTPPISSPNNPFEVTRGLWLEAGRLVVNPKFYAYGTASNIVL